MSPVLAFTLGALFGLLSAALLVHWAIVASKADGLCMHCGRSPFENRPPDA